MIDLDERLIRSHRERHVARLDLEALQPVIRGELPLVLAVNRASDIQTVLRIAKEEELV